MKHLITIALVVFTMPCLFAQFDYQLFRPDVQYLYENYQVDPENLHWYQSETASPIVGMKTDARECQSLYKTIAFNACSPGPSFAGYEICQSPDFTNMDMGDSQYFRLETQAPIGSNWTAGLMDTILVTGRVTKIDTMSFLGLLDTVKTISFFHPDADTLLGFPVMISKNYGLIACARFGDTGRGWTNAPITLLGMSNPQVGLQNYTDEEVFDLQPGDIFHTFEDYSHSPSVRLAIEITSVERAENRVDINYTGKRISSTTILRDGEIVDTIILEDVTSSWGYSGYTFEMMRRQPGEFYSQFGTVGGSYVVAQMFPADLCGLSGKRTSVDMFFRESSNCFINAEAADGTPSFLFYPGLGNSFGEIRSSVNGERILQYAKTSTLECGEPFDYEGIITGLINTPEETSFIAYPNPTTNEFQLSIEGPGSFQLSVLDLLGRSVLSKEDISGSTSVSTESLPAGVYHLLLIQAGRIVGKKRLVIK